MLKKKKPRSLLPVSTSMDHRPKEDMLQDCITLAAVTHGKGDAKVSVRTQTGSYGGQKICVFAKFWRELNPFVYHSDTAGLLRNVGSIQNSGFQ